MSLLQEVRRATQDLSTKDMLRYLIKDRFPGETVVTASLRARSIVLLKMVSEIDPDTPIIFCQRPPVFAESLEYRDKISKLLGLSRFLLNHGHETTVQQGDVDHCERMWVNYRDQPGSSFEVLHLNDSLSPYKCWISAVYHIDRPSYVSERIDVEEKLIRVDPLVGWTQDKVREFMRANELPYHKMAARKYSYDDTDDGVICPTYAF